ncbi:MAG TPA: DEAD/DEAH box helicase family protein [Gemmataceae bacterium]|nr:DEAD/DEAH box helicase family protein [Gemmataceae bacterium]
MDVEAWIGRMDVQPRPYQLRIVSKARDLFQTKGLRSILIDSPTGSGKTVMGLLIARLLQETLHLRVGWVAMRRYLLNQARTENETRRIGVDAVFLSMFDRDPPTGLDLLVVDEAQHDAAQSMTHLHQVVRPRFILGLSATPFRADRVKLCFDAVLKDAGIASLIQDGYLSPYHHYTIPRHTPQSVAEFYLRDRERWGKTLLSFHTLQQCREADGLLRAAGVRSDVVSGDSDRDAQIEAFRSGRLDVLSNCLMLGEGFDCPELKTVFCRPSCKGVTVQLGGRVLRKHPALPYKQIVQCSRTRWPFPRTAAPALQFVWGGGAWRSLQANPFIQEVNSRTLRALARIEVNLPKFLLRRVAGARRFPDGWDRRKEE